MDRNNKGDFIALPALIGLVIAGLLLFGFMSTAMRTTDMFTESSRNSVQNLATYINNLNTGVQSSTSVELDNMAIAIFWPKEVEDIFVESVYTRARYRSSGGPAPGTTTQATLDIGSERPGACAIDKNCICAEYEHVGLTVDEVIDNLPRGQTSSSYDSGHTTHYNTHTLTLENNKVFCYEIHPDIVGVDHFIIRIGGQRSIPIHITNEETPQGPKVAICLEDRECWKGIHTETDTGKYKAGDQLLIYDEEYTLKPNGDPDFIEAIVVITDEEIVDKFLHGSGSFDYSPPPSLFEEPAEPPQQIPVSRKKITIHKSYKDVWGNSFYQVSEQEEQFDYDFKMWTIVQGSLNNFDKPQSELEHDIELFNHQKYVHLLIK